MENTKLNTFENYFNAFVNMFHMQIASWANKLQKSKPYQYLPQVFLFFLVALCLTPEAFAQSGGGGDVMSGLCKVAGWVQKILTAAAVIAVLLYVINSFFLKSSVVGDIILYVIIGCAIATAVIYLIGLTGLNTSGCSLT